MEQIIRKGGCRGISEGTLRAPGAVRGHGHLSCSNRGGDAPRFSDRQRLGIPWAPSWAPGCPCLGGVRNRQWGPLWPLQKWALRHRGRDVSQLGLHTAFLPFPRHRLPSNQDLAQPLGTPPSGLSLASPLAESNCSTVPVHQGSQSPGSQG